MELGTRALLWLLFFASPVAISAQQLGPALPSPEPTTPIESQRFQAPSPFSDAPWIFTDARIQVDRAYRELYIPGIDIEAGWTGSVDDCDPGKTSPAFRQAMVDRINFFRTMAGVNPIDGFTDEYNRMAQAAALMMSAQGNLSHLPDRSWSCYSQDGRAGARSSNLALGLSGPRAIDTYIMDPGVGNESVGHRRWILFPNSQFMGTGDVPYSSGRSSSNALYVFGISDTPERSRTRDGFVAWPPPGHVPSNVVFARWSFQIQGADMADVEVHVTRDGQRQGLNIVYPPRGEGSDFVVWEFQNADSPNQASYTVEIRGVELEGREQNFTYQVNVFTYE